MKALVLFISTATAFSCLADQLTMEQLAPHFPTKAPIFWQAPTNHLPKSFWNYKIVPNTFTASTISNAVILASFQNKGIPQPSTNQVILWDHTWDGDDPFAGSFAIIPDFGEMDFTVKNHARGSPDNIPNDQMIAKLAWYCVAKLGLDPSQLSQAGLQNIGSEYDEKGKPAPEDYVGGRTITLVRKIGGVDFQEESEGFSIEFGSHGVIRSFNLIWPNLERNQASPTVNSAQIIECIRAHRTLVIPNRNEDHYFQRVGSLTNTEKLTIVKITPHFGDGAFGETPPNGERPKTVTPFAELEAIADLGSTNMSLRIYCPITISDLNRVMKLP